MFKIKIFSIGKTKEIWLQEALSEYEKRLVAAAHIEWILAKNEAALEEILLKETSFVALHSQGRQMTSEQFSKWVFDRLEQGGSRLSLAIGGPDGFSDKIFKKASSLVSLSLMTFTHQAARLILLEQLYRAFEIRRGSKYHK